MLHNLLVLSIVEALEMAVVVVAQFVSDEGFEKLHMIIGVKFSVQIYQNFREERRICRKG